MTKRAVIFDFGGVFMKTVDYRPRHTWDDRLGLARGSVESIVHGSESWRAAQLGQISLTDYWADVARQFRLDANELERLKRDYFSGDQLDSELVAYARELRTRGHIVALLSNDSPALADKLTQLGIADLFDPLIISANIGVMKPDARTYQIILDRIGRKADEAIFIDDMPANIQGAQQVGLHAIHYTTTSNLIPLLEPLLNP
jgi:epoxide hydrolase-like predicted phosphatase